MIEECFEGAAESFTFDQEAEWFFVEVDDGNFVVSEEDHFGCDVEGRVFDQATFTV